MPYDKEAPGGYKGGGEGCGKKRRFLASVFLHTPVDQYG
jgi:hypothetical protein